MNLPRIDIRNLYFSFGEEILFKDLSLELVGEQLVGIIGVNGSGKSTLLKILLGIIKIAHGEIRLCGHSPRDKACRLFVGAALQDIDFPQSEKVIEVLKFVAAQFKESEPIESLVEDFFLSEFTQKACGQLSGGMKRRLALACALLGRPKILLLDEPTTGLDLPSRRQLIVNLKKYQVRNGAIVLMVSHHPEDILESVSCFWHVKNGNIGKLSPAEMSSWTQLKKVKFQSSQAWSWPQAHRQGRDGSKNWYVVHNSDELTSRLITSGHKFSDLTIEKMGSDEILGEIL